MSGAAMEVIIPRELPSAAHYLWQRICHITRWDAHIFFYCQVTQWVTQPNFKNIFYSSRYPNLPVPLSSKQDFK